MACERAARDRSQAALAEDDEVDQVKPMATTSSQVYSSVAQLSGTITPM